MAVESRNKKNKMGRLEEGMKLAILFDVDDTLYDMTQPFEKAFMDVFQDRYPKLDWRSVYVAGRKHSDEVFEAAQRGEMPMDDMYVYRWSRAMEDFGIFIHREDALYFQKVYKKYQKTIFMTEKIEHLLELCQREGVLTGVITNGPSRHQWNKTKALKISRWIPDKAVIVSADVEVMKPDPEIFWIAEKKLNFPGLGIQKEDCWFVGDTFETDMKGALAAGWRTIWFNRRNHPMPKEKTDRVVKSEEELFRTIQELIYSHKK